MPFLRAIPLLKMIQAYRGRIGRSVLGARRERHDDVLAFPVVDAIHVHQDSAFFDTELRSLTDGQNNCMLPVPWTEMKNDAIGFEDILRAQMFLRPCAARDGLYLEKLAGLIRLEIVSVSK